jgi:hypothetical protein
MGIGIVSNEEFEKALNKSVPLPTPKVEIVDGPVKGRGKGSNEVPQSLRNIIGEEAIINGRGNALDLAKVFGLEGASVSAYTNGSTSTATYNKQPGLDKLNESKLRVSGRALKRLNLALSSLTPEKLQDTKAVELASVARSMSAIIKDMEPESPHSSMEGGGNIGPTYILYAPQIKEERQYEVIDARE